MKPFYENKLPELHIGSNSGFTFPAHLHDAVELIYIRKGYINVTINQRKCQIAAGEFAIVFPEIVHEYQSDPMEENQVLLIIFPENMFGPYLNQLKRYHPEQPFLKKNQIHADIIYALKRIEVSYEEDAPFFLQSAWIQVILSHVFPLLKLQKNLGPDNIDLTYRLVQYISLHFEEPISLESLSRELNISKYYLSHIFSQKLHMGFHEYLNNIRLDYTLHLIRTTNDNFTKICADAGFESQRTFNRVFKEKFGVSPKEYRQG